MKLFNYHMEQSELTTSNKPTHNDLDTPVIVDTRTGGHLKYILFILIFIIAVVIVAYLFFNKNFNSVVVQSSNKIRVLSHQNNKVVNPPRSTANISSTSDTTIWPVYKNTKYMYSISYPKEWITLVSLNQSALKLFPSQVNTSGISNILINSF